MSINKVKENGRSISLAEYRGFWAFGETHFQAISNLLGVLYLLNK